MVASFPPKNLIGLIKFLSLLGFSKLETQFGVSGQGKNLFSDVSPRPFAGLSLHEVKIIQKRNGSMVSFCNYLSSISAWLNTTESRQKVELL